MRKNKANQNSENLEKLTFIVCFRKNENDKVKLFKVDGYKIDDVYAYFDRAQLKEIDICSDNLINWIICERVYDNYYWLREGFWTKSWLMFFHKVYSLVDSAFEGQDKRRVERRRKLIEESKMMEVKYD